MVTKSKKAPTKKAQKTNNKSKTIGILAGITAAFCVIDEIFAIIWWGEVDWLETCILIGIALLSIFLCAAYKKKSQRSVDVLAGAVAILALVYHIVYFSNILPFILPFSGTAVLPTLCIILDVVILAVLIAFVCTYFVGMGKNGKKAIVISRRLNITIVVAAVCAMIANLAVTIKLPTVIEENAAQMSTSELMGIDAEEVYYMAESTRFVALGEALSYYILIIAAVSLVQKSQKA